MNTSIPIIKTPEPLSVPAVARAYFGVDDGASGSIACITPVAAPKTAKGRRQKPISGPENPEPGNHTNAS
jgi:hypothetical protein